MCEGIMKVGMNNECIMNAFDEGVDLLKQYRLEVDRFEVQRQDLANAEKLFDLPITMYHDLIQLQKELKGLEQIFLIYEEQKVCYSLAILCNI